MILSWTVSDIIYIYYYTIIDICWGGHKVLLNSKLQIDRREAEAWSVIGQ